MAYFVSAKYEMKFEISYREIKYFLHNYKKNEQNELFFKKISIYYKKSFFKNKNINDKL